MKCRLKAAIALIFALTLTPETLASSKLKKHYNAWDMSEHEGCVLDGKRYAVEEKVLMNREAIQRSYKETGFMPSDGMGVLMKCTYLVNPKEDDHPKLEDREYLWVAFSW